MVRCNATETIRERGVAAQRGRSLASTQPLKARQKQQNSTPSCDLGALDWLDTPELRRWLCKWLVTHWERLYWKKPNTSDEAPSAKKSIGSAPGLMRPTRTPRLSAPGART